MTGPLVVLAIDPFDSGCLGFGLTFSRLLFVACSTFVLGWEALATVDAERIGSTTLGFTGSAGGV